MPMIPAMNFAREHGKKFAFPEWGVIAGNENSGGDNPKFIDYAYGWMEQNADIMRLCAWAAA